MPMVLHLELKNKIKMENMKYRILSETKVVDNITLHRIECVTAFGDVECGAKGGWIESENNLSQDGGAWVGGNATVSGNVMVCGDARVFGDAIVCGNAKVRGNADYIVFKNWWSSGRYFTWTRSNNKWKVGCFYGSGEELIVKAYKNSEISGREYERIVEICGIYFERRKRQ